MMGWIIGIAIGLVILYIGIRIKNRDKPIYTPSPGNRVKNIFNKTCWTPC